ncbi:hypothetical protein [Deefgea sp. CFH1-16]|uniref:hypothetical protein n=1 Tax=Deefgea sp. CFH1-16 TaxID=2675457 RepID=UPI0015F71663|nr:hypothetical protein [Deefgea sp. CFH1-16]MBM5574928.1 hypothetical protein [Deefgea sp. CFH1-16]
MLNAPSDLLQFDQELRELIGVKHDARPFLCEGLPFGCPIFLVGINPGKNSEFWPHWNAIKGCNKRGWMEDYCAKHGRLSPTRARIERLFKAMGTLRCLETNIFPFASPRESDLDASLRNTRVFDFLLKSIRPQVMFVHGATAIEHLVKLTGSNLPKGQFTTVTYLGNTFEIFAGNHLSYQWSYAEVDDLGRILADRCSEKLTTTRLIEAV